MTTFSVGNSSGQSLDAIVVPTNRPAGFLSYALEFAKATNAFLLVLCSGRSSTRSITSHINSAGVYGLAVNVPVGYQHPLFSDFETDNFPEALFGRATNDISLKRNIGLLAGRLAGWRHMLFLDDDITRVEGIDQAIALQRNASTAGFLVNNFPDNSVVRHAERLSGVEPGVRLTGSALLVDPMTSISFFPRIYNEDWFFLFGMGNNAFGSVIAGAASQSQYNPFAKPARAASEEFGDLLAEGMLQLTNEGLDYLRSTESDWEHLIADRRALIKKICNQLAGQTNDQPYAAVIKSLLAAELRLYHIKPRTCVSYLAAWRRDLDVFRARFALLSHQETPIAQIFEAAGPYSEQSTLATLEP